MSPGYLTRFGGVSIGNTFTINSRRELLQKVSNRSFVKWSDGPTGSRTTLDAAHIVRALTPEEFEAIL